MSLHGPPDRDRRLQRVQPPANLPGQWLLPIQPFSCMSDSSLPNGSCLNNGIPACSASIEIPIVDRKERHSFHLGCPARLYFGHKVPLTEARWTEAIRIAWIRKAKSYKLRQTGRCCLPSVSLRACADRSFRRWSSLVAVPFLVLSA